MTGSLSLDTDFVYPVYEVCVTAQEQARKLACCDIDPALYNGYADITHFAMETIMAAKRGGASINGSVHVSQYFEQRSPIRLGESLELKGEVSGVEAVPKGDLVTSRFEACRPSGEVALVLTRESLRVDPEKAAAQGGTRTPTPQPDASGMTRLAVHPLQPDKVARYSEEGENLIHSDPEVARQFGFRAPIAAGLMAVRFMMAHLWRDGPLRSLEMTVRFRRPMFWDDALELRGAGEPIGQLAVVRSDDGKVANDAVVHRFSREA